MEIYFSFLVFFLQRVRVLLTKTADHFNKNNQSLQTHFTSIWTMIAILNWLNPLPKKKNKRRPSQLHDLAGLCWRFSSNLDWHKVIRLGPNWRPRPPRQVRRQVLSPFLSAFIKSIFFGGIVTIWNRTAFSLFLSINRFDFFTLFFKITLSACSEFVSVTMIKQDYVSISIAYTIVIIVL